MNKDKLPSIAAQFALAGTIQSISPYGSGHIHDTFCVKTDARRYILQHINTHVFGHPDQVMENIAAVTAHLSHRYACRGESSQNRVLQILPTLQGNPFFRDEEGLVWRVYAFIEGGVSVDVAESLADCRACGLAFGQFQHQLADFPADSLHETIPAFHHTPTRFLQLQGAIARDPLGRAAGVQREIDFYLSRKDFYSLLEDSHEKGELPLRVTHNDTKINNCILDAQTRQPLCVLDLDTVMPGYAVNDFGDAIRSGAGTAPEDARDESAMQLDFARYEAYFRGFMEGCGDSLTPSEILLLPAGAKMMTLECGMRFLADYLDGDAYFKIDYPLHNLHRTRTQMALAASIEAQWDTLINLSASYL